MWKTILAALLLAGCAQIPPSVQDIEAKQFQPVSDKAVIYIVRDILGPPLDDTLWLGESEMITTHTGTYYRWEVAPGTQRISGFGVSTASLTLTADAGKIYFVHHVVIGTDRAGVLVRFLERYDDQTGRARVAQASLL